MPKLIPSNINLPLKVDGTPEEEIAQLKQNKQNAIFEKVADKNDEFEKQEIAKRGNIQNASADAIDLRAQTVSPGATSINPELVPDQNTESLSDIHKAWTSEVAQGFMRGVGQSISSTGDLINFIGAGIGANTLMEGNIFGNALTESGESVEAKFKSYLPEELQNENITWGSLMDSDFWSKRASEMIPLALEFLFLSHGASTAAKKGASSLARKAGAGALEAATQTTSTINKLKGLTKVDDVIGSGKGLIGKLIRNVDGTGELTKLGADATGFLAAGVTSNMMAGAMNAMELHKTLKAETNPDGTPKYNEDELADAASGAFMTNMLYLPIDVLSWGVTYGGGLKNLKGMMPGKQLLNSSAEVLADASKKFTFSSMPFLKAAARVGKKALFEGAEETFQETFEEWAKLKGAEKVTGAETPNYFDFYMSDENRATLVLSAAAGGLMGGGFNIREAINGNADNMLKYVDRVENFRSSIDSEDKLGQEAREYHMHNQMFDLINEGKEELFGDFLSSMIEKGQVSEEQGAEYERLFGTIKENIDLASNLNVKGKEALMRNTVEANFLEQSIERDIEGRKLAIQTIGENFSEDADSDLAGAIQEQTRPFDESIEAKLIQLSKAKANRLNLLSGKLADPTNIKFVLSKTGKEHFIIEDQIISNTEDTSNEDMAMGISQGGLVSGLSTQQQREYSAMSDQEIYAEALERNKVAKKSLKGRALDIFNKAKSKYLPEEEITPVAAELSTEPQDGASTEPTELSTEADAVSTEPQNEIDEEEREALIEKANGLLQDQNDFVTERTSAEATEENPAVTAEQAIAEFEQSEKGKQLAEINEKLGVAIPKENSESQEAEKSKEKVNPAFEKASKPTEEQSKSNSKKTVESRKENESDFEKEAIDNPDFLSEKKKTLRQKQAEESEKIVKDFLAGENNEVENPSIKKEKESVKFKKSNFATRALGIKEYSFERSLGNDETTGEEIFESFFADSQEEAEKMIDDFYSKDNSKTGRASIISRLFNRKKGSEPDVTQSQVTNELYRRISDYNTSQASLKRNIGLKSISNNPENAISRNELDRYLDSTISKFEYGPNQVQKMIALNKRLRSLGIDIDVVSASNLFDTVGIDAAGYAVANTIFIDEKAWEQTDLLMHEMSHIYYRTMKNSPVVKGLIGKAQNNLPFVENLKTLYSDDVKYFDESEPDVHFSMRDLDLQGENNAEFIASNNFKESPMEFQDVINEELFANYIQGPLSEQFSSYFKPLQEFGRKKEVAGFWNWLKGKSVEYVQDNRDLVKELNAGRSVDDESMKQHIMKGFVDALSNKQGLNASGAASLISAKNKAEKAELKTISNEKIKQQNNFNKKELREKYAKSIKEQTVENIKKEIDSIENLTEKQRELVLERAMEDLENGYEENNLFDDFEQMKSLHIKGATRIVNSFVKSLNYVKRQARLRNADNLASDYNDDLLLDRDAMISELFNLAYETKGETGKFINAIENSEIQEVDAFSKYLDKMYPDSKLAILNSMAWVMSNQRTISGVKSYVDSKGKHVFENALSEREKNKVDSHMKYLERTVGTYYSSQNDENSLADNSAFENFLASYSAVKQNRASNQDYLNMLTFLAPQSVMVSNIIKANDISFKGQKYTVKSLLDNFVKSKVIEQGNNLYIPKSRSLVEALTDTNRKYTSYSSIQNAEGNFEPSKITNNHLLSEINSMNEMLATKPSFKKFKEAFGHINDASKRKYQNPVLKSIYDNYMSGKSIPSVTQYFGLKHEQAKINNLYKNSTDFTQSIEDFMMFNGSKNSYLQNMGAFADSPRKFFMGVDKLQFSEMFTNEGSLTKKGTDQLQNAFNIYEKLNENLPESQRDGLYKNLEEFARGLNRSVRNERMLWETFGNDLKASSNLAPFFESNGRLNLEGKKKLTEYVFNNVVNGLALAEVFNPGVAVKDIVKRNKGNSSPVNAIGNKNLKIEPVIIPDANDKTITDSAMYMLREDADKIIKAGLGVFDLNNGLKLLNYSIDRANPNFANRAAYFKGYTTILDESTLLAEPGLRGVYEMLKNRREKYNELHNKKYGENPSEDLLNGEINYLNVAIPMSAIKSDFLTPQQKARLNDNTFERMNEAVESKNFEDFAAMAKVYDDLFYDADGEFMGISGYNFGPQQVMDKVTTQSVTPVQFISSLIVNGASQGTLLRAEEIQRLIRAEETDAMDKIIKQLNNMNPADYKKFILENMDLDNMDQSQRLIMEEQVNNLNHTAIEDFVLNTLANRLKSAGNKLKTAGTIAQQKSNVGYRIPFGYYVNGSRGLQGYQTRADGGVNPLEIVLPQQMEGSVRAREYMSIYDEKSIFKHMKPSEVVRYQKADRAGQLDMIKMIAQSIALKVNPQVDNDKSYGSKRQDLIGTVEDKNGNPIGYFVRGELVLATRVPSHGPASTGVFEAVDFLTGEGNQTIVSNEFSKVIGSDYDGDALFIQRKSKGTPSFNKALDLTAELWTSPEMADQIQAPIDFEDKVAAIVKDNAVSNEKVMPMSPEYTRQAYNNTMVSKRSIGVIFNMHRLANYLAAYNVRLSSPITINGTQYSNFADGEAGANSRNNMSAQLANIILDNTKYGFADKLGLNDQTINQFALLTNMGVSLSDLNAIMNSKAVKVWTKYKKNNQSPYLKNRTNAELTDLIKSELGITSSVNPTSFINTSAMDSPQQSANIIQVMTALENMNSDVLKLSKIMAGHKGIENNPFVLENQINDFNSVINNEGDHLIFNADFANNPDIKAYQNNAVKILDILKKANKIFRTSTDKMLTEVNQELSIDKMNDNQLRRASDIMKRFVNSRMLGLNNITEEEKTAVQERLFNNIFDYMNDLKSVRVGEQRNGLEKSILFQKALNAYIYTTKDGVDSNRSYLSANPQFFNESLSSEEKKAVQREFAELPNELKDDMIVYDLMKNGLTGNLSLVHIFDNDLNYNISNLGYYDQLFKNKEIGSTVMNDLEKIIISNEMLSPDSSLPTVNFDGKVTQENMPQVVAKNGAIFNKMKAGEKFYFGINQNGFKSFYEFKGIPAVTLSIMENMKSRTTRNEFLAEQIKDNVSAYVPIKGDLNLKAISIADGTTFSPLKSTSSYNYDSKADHIVEATMISNEKKKDNIGRASKIDYHNYNDFRELTKSEYDRVMEYNPAVSDTQKQLRYEEYKIEKAKANDLARTINQASVVKMSDSEIKELYDKYSENDVYAYSIVTTPIVMEFANRSMIEQSKITGREEDGSDMSLISSWMNNNNIPSNHPATQALTRKLTDGYKNFVRERGKYIKEINSVTDALYKEKFGLSNNRIVAVGQRLFNSLFKNRTNVYENLYGNLVETNMIKLPDGKARKEFKFKTPEEIKSLYDNGNISEAEFNFYNTFRKITGELEEFGSDGKSRRDYIPHTAMNNFELFSSRGVLGLLVNSREENDALNDVKIYADVNGKEELVSFKQLKDNFNATALENKNNIKDVMAFNRYKRKAKKLLKENKNEDGTALEYSNVEKATLLGMGPMSRFSNSRSVRAEQMPSMDLNKALVDYVHSTLFANGNESFEGFKELMPLIDGVMAYNEKNGYKNAYGYVREVMKEKFINKKDQELLGGKADKVINGIVKGNLLYALGYKGFIVGKGLYAIGNTVIGKYMNVKREGGKAWLNGELRYWGTDKGFGIEALDRRKRAKNILNNLGFMEIDIYDDVAVESKSGLDGIFTSLALLPMSATEDWIQKAHFLGTMTDEEFDLFDDDGNYKDGVERISQERIVELEERVKATHGKGYMPTDQSRIQTYSLGRMFMQFSRHLPTHIRERFAKEDVDMHGNKYVGSMRQMYVTASDIVSNKMSPEKFKEYWATLKPHEKEALKAGLRGMAMVTLAGFVDASMDDSADKMSADNISRGVVGDANVHFDLDKLSYKMVPPSIRSITALLYGAGNNAPTASTVE